MEISDIQICSNDLVEITFCNDDLVDVLSLKISKSDVSKIAKFFQSNLSYGAELKRIQKQVVSK